MEKNGAFANITEPRDAIENRARVAMGVAFNLSDCFCFAWKYAESYAAAAGISIMMPEYLLLGLLKCAQMMPEEFILDPDGKNLQDRHLAAKMELLEVKRMLHVGGVFDFALARRTLREAISGNRPTPWEGRFILEKLGQDVCAFMQADGIQTLTADGVLHILRDNKFFKVLDHGLFSPLTLA